VFSFFAYLSSDANLKCNFDVCSQDSEQQRQASEQQRLADEAIEAKRLAVRKP